MPQYDNQESILLRYKKLLDFEKSKRARDMHRQFTEKEVQTYDKVFNLIYKRNANAKCFKIPFLIY